jgi:hypothetical protein
MTFQNPTATLYTPPATAITTPANPTAPASTSAYKCQGLAALLTPQMAAGNVLVIIQGSMNASATTVGNGMNIQGAYGPMISGVAAPANAAALPAAGVLIGNPLPVATGVTLTTAADAFTPVTWVGLVKGLTPGTQYWFDAVAESITTASDNGLTSVTVTLVEIG